MIRPCTAADAARWDAYVNAHPDARSYHLTAWRRIIEESFGHRSYSLLSEDAQGRVNGVLPLARLRSRMFGDFLVSVPYVNYGGVCADDDAIAGELIREAVRVSREQHVDHLEIRTETTADLGLRVRSAKVAMRLALPPSPEELWKSLSTKLRTKIRRAQQENMKSRVGGEDQLDAFYHVFSINMRDLGTPVYSKSFFRSILRELGKDAQISTVYLGQEPVASGFLVGYRDTVEIPWASSLKQHARLNPNIILYWDILEHACAQGYKTFDFGRSSPDSGPYHFKTQWRPKEIPLHWHYWVKGDAALPELSPQSPKFQAAVRMWQRLPVPVTRVLGPMIVKNLP